MTANHLTRFAAPIVLGLSTALLPACGMLQGAKTETAAEQAKPMSDGEILAVVSAINQGELKQAELAMQRSQNPQVRSVAQTIIADHTDIQRRAQSLAATADMQPKQNELSQALTKQARQMEEKLRGLTGEEFDKAYLQGQERLHELALKTVRDDLMPSARSAQLRELLSAAAPELQQHKELATEKQRSTRG